MKKMVKVPVGFEVLAGELNKMAGNKQAYIQQRVSMPHFCIELDEGDDRTKVLSYIADFYAYHKLCYFSGKERYLEFTLDGTVGAFQECFLGIAAEANYQNHYSGVLGLDIMGLANEQDDDCLSWSLKLIAEAARHTTVVFFCSEKMNRRQKVLVERAKKALGDVKNISIYPSMQCLQLKK